MVVGAFAGFITLPLVVFRVTRGTERLLSLIGAVGVTPRLDYYPVPAGESGIQATVTLGPDP